MRTKNSLRNSSFAFGGQLLSVLLSFLTRTIFIRTLDVSYLGVNGLFSSVLSILSFAELGIGTAIIYALYKPVADNEIEKICALMNYYEKAYRIIGMVVALLGLVLVPFLGYLIKGNLNIPNLTFIYLLFLLNSVASYFFVYKRSIIFVSQNGYINTINQNTFLVVQNVIQILVLFLAHNFLLYLMVQIICSIVANVLISKKANEMFPYLKKNKQFQLDSLSKKNITKNVIAMMSHKMGSVIVSGTDNLLISSFIGVVWVGIYSNYILIINTVISLLVQIFNAIASSVGNLTALEDKERSYSVFKTLFFANFWFFGFCAVGLGVMINPFIKLWIGEKYIFDYSIVVIIIINFFIYGMRQTSIVYINALGLFWQIKYKSIFEALINLLMTLFFLEVLNMGIYGVLLGTTLSTITTNVWWEPFVVYKYGFNKSLIFYFKNFTIYILIGSINFLISYWLCGLINYNSWFGLIYRGLICVIVSNGFILLAFYRSSEFKNLTVILNTYVIKPLRAHFFVA
jgi:O-antigen/teichoic acid export membrane protein